MSETLTPESVRELRDWIAYTLPRTGATLMALCDAWLAANPDAAAREVVATLEAHELLRYEGGSDRDVAVALVADAMKRRQAVRHDEIDRMEAGCEMDALVAERVMGWELIERAHAAHPGGYRIRHSCVVRSEWMDDYGPTVRLFSPSTDIAAAWQVFGKLAVHIVIWRDDGGWTARIYQKTTADESWEGAACTAPLAICRAALKAVTA